MLDLRLPIGWFFLINALLLIGVGLVQPQCCTVPMGAMAINLDLIWGLVMGAFGVLMVGLSHGERWLKRPKT